MLRVTAFCIIFLVVTTASAEIRDPMKPPAYALNKMRLEKLAKMPTRSPAPVRTQQEPRWVLTSILYSDQRQHAIINERVVRKGDVIKGARVIALRPDRVKLRLNEQIMELHLREPVPSIRITADERQQ